MNYFIYILSGRSAFECVIVVAKLSLPVSQSIYFSTFNFSKMLTAINKYPFFDLSEIIPDNDLGFLKLIDL